MPGSDLVRYSVALGNAQGPFHVEAELWYQPIGFRWAHNLEPYQAEEPQRIVSDTTTRCRRPTAIRMAHAEASRYHIFSGCSRYTEAVIHPFSTAQSSGMSPSRLGHRRSCRKMTGHLKFLNGSQCAFYAAHFVLLGNYPAMGSLMVSAARSFLSLKTRSRWVALLFLSINVAVGWLLVHSRAGWLPIAGGCLATIALFLMRGIPMRLVLLASTLCWMANNILSGSIGGVMLETIIASANVSDHAFD